MSTTSVTLIMLLYNKNDPHACSRVNTKNTEMNLPTELQNIILSMFTGRERIELWMKWKNITDRKSTAVHTRLLQWYMDKRTDTDEQTLIHISSPTILQTKLPKGIESVVFIYPWVESVPDHWLSSNSSLKRIHFADLSSLTTIGNNWMSGCSNLVANHLWIRSCSRLHPRKRHT